MFQLLSKVKTKCLDGGKLVVASLNEWMTHLRSNPGSPLYLPARVIKQLRNNLSSFNRLLPYWLLLHDWWLQLSKGDRWVHHPSSKLENINVCQKHHLL